MPTCVPPKIHKYIACVPAGRVSNGGLAKLSATRAINITSLAKIVFNKLNRLVWEPLVSPIDLLSLISKVDIKTTQVTKYSTFFHVLPDLWSCRCSRSRCVLHEKNSYYAPRIIQFYRLQAITVNCPCTLLPGRRTRCDGPCRPFSPFMILRVFFLYKRDTALRQTTKYSYIRDTDIPHSILETCWKMTSVNMITKINFSVMKFTFESSFLSFLPSFTCFLSFFSSCLLFSFFFFAILFISRELS